MIIVMAKKTTFNVSKVDNFSEWYSEILQKAEVTDLRYDVKGFVVIRPWGALIIDKMYRIYEDALRKTGHEPVMFPAVIPEDNFKKEANHIKGFAPELFWLENKKGEDRLALRPTSETAFFQMYSLWIRSYRDLPFKRYQRANIFRDDTKSTRPLIRGKEFYWLETHDVFSNKEDADVQVQGDIKMTDDIVHKCFGVPGLLVRRPEWDKFPGAVYTIASDCLMPDGKLLQNNTMHLLGQNFSKPFNVKFVDENEKDCFGWQTTYGPGISRILASVLSVHGDDSGLVLPYILAPIQVVIVPFDGEGVEEAVRGISKDLMTKGINVKVDNEDKRPGEKFFFWEMKGVPFRIEVGIKELEKGKASVFIRDTKERVLVKIEKLSKEIIKMGVEYDARLLARADGLFDSKIVDCDDKNSIGRILESGKIARFSFCSIDKDGKDCAGVIEKEFAGEVRGTRADLFPRDDSGEPGEEAWGKCPVCGKKAEVVVYAGKSY